MRWERRIFKSAFSETVSSSLSTGSSTPLLHSLYNVVEQKQRQIVTAVTDYRRVRNVRMEHNRASNIIKAGITTMRETCTQIINIGTTATGSHTVPRYIVHPVSGMNQLETYSS